METALAVMIASFILSCITTVLVLYFFKDYKTGFSGLVRLSAVLEEVLVEKDTSEMLYESINTFHSLGSLAQNANAIMSDEEAFDGMLTELAVRVRKSLIGFYMGTASGDVKKKTHAEGVLNEAIIEGAKKMNPILGLFLSVTGLDEELRKNPEMTGYILQLVSEKGLMNLLDSNVLSLPRGEQEAAVKSAAQSMGIDF